MNCIDVILFQAEIAPEKTAVIAFGNVVTYGRLVQGILSAQYRLAGAGLQPGQRVGLCIAHPIDHLIIACSLYRMKIASASLPDDADAHLDSIGFDAFVTDRVNPAFSAKQPTARILALDTSWFKDQIPRDVTERTRVNRHERTDWISRLYCDPDDNGKSGFVETTAADLEDRLIQYLLSAPPDWDRMICIQNMSSSSALLHGLSALSQGRTVCFADVGSCRHLTNLFKHHYLVASPQQVASLVALQKSNFVEMPSLRAMFLEGEDFPRELVADCLALLSSNLTVGYHHPRIGLVAFGAANRMSEIEGATGFVAPWVQAEIADSDANPLPADAVGEIRFRRHRHGNISTADAALPADHWIYPGRKGSMTSTGLLSIR